VLVARKIGAPRQPELGLGAVAEGGEPILDQRFLRTVGVTEADLAPTIERERGELRRRVELYRGDRELPSLAGRDVVLVDDGLATGSTARAALAALRPRRPRRLVLAVPVASPRTVEALSDEADEIVCLQQPESFQAVGQWYRDFSQTDDRTVVRLLSDARYRRSG
jgi:putative phosphoribosyl transferase